MALFDLDGTVTKRDTMFDFLRFGFGLRRLLLGLILTSPYLVLYKLRIIANDKAKKRVIRYFLGGMSREELVRLGSRYAQERMTQIVNSKAMNRLRWHLNQGHRVIVVTASIEEWVKPWCDREGIELIATRLEDKNGTITGSFAGLNCHGSEKVRRIRELVNLRDLKYVYAYGNSRGDRDMLSMANEAHYRTF